MYMNYSNFTGHGASFSEPPAGDNSITGASAPRSPHMGNAIVRTSRLRSAVSPEETSSLIIFDFDGTIGNTQALIVKTLRQTMNELGLPERTEEECTATIGLPLHKAFISLYDNRSTPYGNGGATDDEAFGQHCATVYRRIFKENNKPGTVTVFPNVRETLAELSRRGKTMTIATSRERSSLTAMLREMDIEKYFSYMVCGSDVQNAKPAPDMVLVTLEHLGIPADKTLVVGDTAFDITMGRSAGTGTCGVTYGNGLREQLAEAGADFIIDDFAGLKNIV